MEAALYDPGGGFYATSGSAGRRNDFLTSPEVGPLFGAVLARALDHWWAEAGEPDPWFVVDVGAGPGTLARSVLSAGPACSPALRYVLVERSAAQRARHAEHLPLEPAGWAFANLPDDEDEPTPTGLGPLVVSLAELPEVALRGVIVANELVDNLPFALCERTAEGWAEVRVGADGDRLVEVVVPARPPVGEVVATLAGEASVGARAAVHTGATPWLADALERLIDGRVVVIDYTTTTASMAERPMDEWVRTYHQHGRGTHPLDDPGLQDVTVEVALDQLVRSRVPARVSTQAEFLERHGLAGLVDEGRRVWAERASLGDLAAFKARSRIREAEALTDPTGLGAFTVAEWVVPPTP